MVVYGIITIFFCKTKDSDLILSPEVGIQIGIDSRFWLESYSLIITTKAPYAALLRVCCATLNNLKKCNIAVGVVAAFLTNCPEMTYYR